MDDNEVLEKQEKWGGKNYNPKKAKYAFEFMDNMRMSDLGTIGPKFTWSNKRKGLAHIKERLTKWSVISNGA